jgi:superfamily II DNA or RNA helicase
MGVAVALDFERVVWVAHRRELVAQAAERLRGDGLEVGALCPGLPRNDEAPVQVGTIQTLLAGGHAPPADLVVLDEAHHYARAARHWSGFQDAYQDSKILGLTATPERQDGSPLGDIFTGIVEAATYSELIRAGHLVGCDVFRADAGHVEKAWARDPVSAYLADGAGGPGFLFVDRVDRAEEWAGKFSGVGVPSGVIAGATPADVRADRMERFAEGRLRILANVYTLTEGVDVPAAQVAIMGIVPGCAAGYLQRVGRVLRPAPGKDRAILLDIAGASHKWGLPTEDRAYTLEGKCGIATAEASTTRTCLACGHVYARTLDACPMCGEPRPRQEPPAIRIYSSALRLVYAGTDTAPEHKRAEYRRLRALAAAKGWSLGWVVKEYGKLFPDESPNMRDVTADEWRREHARLMLFASERGFRPGWVGYRFKALSGRWPDRTWGFDWRRYA